MNKLTIYAGILEQEAVHQITKMNECDAYKDCTVRIMPDCHAGTGCTIGTVIAIKDRVVPNTVGVDIGCGMLVTELGKQHVDLQKLDQVINALVPSGFNIHEKPYAYCEDIKYMFCKSAFEAITVHCAIGSLGGGNHFIELNEDAEGNKYLVIHSGSRNLGKRVCEYYQKLAIEHCQRKAYDERAIIQQLKQQGREREIQAVIREAKANAPKVDKELAYLEGELLEQYLHDMKICQHYASMNRHMIARIICDAMKLVVDNQFETIHNYIDIEHKILRKGAVRALGDEKLIIPMNMRDGSLICVGKGNLDWLYSAPHGAGRVMSRKKAKETLALQDFKKSMQGIYTTSVCEETIDEAPMVYKPMQEILAHIQETVSVQCIIKPLYNFKAKQ